MRSNFHRLIHNKLSIFIVIGFLIIPNIEIIQHLIEKYKYGTTYHPAFSFFLSGSTRGHALQFLMLWFLPVYYLLIAADTPIQDLETGYKNILISKIGKKRYVLQKYIIAFLSSSLSMAAALLINFSFVYILFKNSTFMRSLDEIQAKENILFSFSIEHPYLAILLFALVATFLSGLIGVLASSLSIFFPKRKFAYAAAFFIWFMFVLKENSVMYLFQPFAEYGFEVLIPIFIQVVLVLLIIPLAVYYYEVKYNEN
ncbi:hypothetical protein [Paraliobacillus ryukyuensis]|uniref:hypothetical protein n=1 Tax=Paraliobacillus ryukyuensis TaxID=200904 RepID=UPI0009A84108|nr:hypothetical protein [Paraliobacillus ryukyuensis]